MEGVFCENLPMQQGIGLRVAAGIVIVVVLVL